MKKINWLLASFLLLIIAASCSIGKKQPTEAIKGMDKPGHISGSQVKNETADELSTPVLESRFLDKDMTTTRVFIYVTAYKGQNPIELQEFVSRHQLNYVIYTDYGSRERLGYGNVRLDETNTTKSEDQIVISFDIKKPAGKESGVLLAELGELGTLKKTLNDLPIRFYNTRTADRLGIFKDSGTLTKKHYVSTNTPISVQSLTKETIPLTVFYYKHQFEPAASPMNTSPKSVGKELVVDSTFQINTNEVHAFTQNGLYYMVTDTSNREGLSLLVTDDRFPKVTNPEMLRGPVQYMSTNQEVKDLNNSESAKKALDKYWLSLANGNQDMARGVIRNYYSRVEEANRLFTTYKEGWKTDKGMIFIVLGNPDKVQRSKDREVWIYNQRGNANNINFTFNKRNNQFVEDHYELVRYAEYQPIWYPIVEAWRTGAIR